MKYLSITIFFCFVFLIAKSQVNPYTLNTLQVDSLHGLLKQTINDTMRMEITTIFAIYYCENDKDSSVYFINRTVDLATKLDLASWKCVGLNFMGLLYNNIGDYPKAWHANYEAFQIANSKSFNRNFYPAKWITGIPPWLMNRECQLANVYEMQAFLYYDTNDLENAAASNEEAIQIAEKIGDTESLPQYLDMSANICWSRNKSDSAIILEQKALSISQGAKWQYYTGDIYGSLGWFYRLKNNHSLALKNFKRCAVTSHHQHNLSLEYLAYIDIADLFLEMQQPDSTITYCNIASSFNYRIQQKFSIANICEHLFAAYQMKGNRDSAFAYLLLAKHLRDSLNSDDRAQAARYQKMNFNEQLRRQKTESERSRQKSRMITYSTLAGLTIAFLIVFLLYRNNRQKQKTNIALAAIRDLQDKKISQLDEAVTKRTEQLNSFRQAMATDFHDQTGNLLSAITRQASLLKLKLHSSEEVITIVESIITNSNELYDSSKDFLWNLNHNSDEPLEVFHYLINYGQIFYNQFNIAFSAEVRGEIHNLQQLDSFAALNLIYIFKEGMTNVVKHANAREVFIEMKYADDKVVFALQDNGKWKAADDRQQHYGLNNIERRCAKNNFGFLLCKQNEGTRIEISVPVKINIIS